MPFGWSLQSQYRHENPLILQGSICLITAIAHWSEYKTLVLSSSQAGKGVFQGNEVKTDQMFYKGQKRLQRRQFLVCDNSWMKSVVLVYIAWFPSYFTWSSNQNSLWRRINSPILTTVWLLKVNPEMSAYVLNVSKRSTKKWQCHLDGWLKVLNWCLTVTCLSLARICLVHSATRTYI